MKNVAIILSGAGQFDGSETHETISTLLALSQENIDWMAFAPDIPQALVVDHLTGQPDPNAAPRQVLHEAARLVRGKIAPLQTLIDTLNTHPAAFDAIVIPGGYGAVIHLCNFKEKGFDFTFQPDVETVLRRAKALKLPMGFICIAPVMIPSLFPGATLTIGNDPELARQIDALGCHHQICKGNEIAVDTTHRVVSTPANMVGPALAELHEGIRALVRALKEFKSSSSLTID